MTLQLYIKMHKLVKRIQVIKWHVAYLTDNACQCLRKANEIRIRNFWVHYKLY